MSVYKDKAQGTWYTSFRYIGWTGKKRQKMKRGFKTKREALNYENEFKKYGEKLGKSSKTADRMTYQIVEKAKFSDGNITDREVVIVKRHLDLLKRKNRNVTKILSKLK